VFSAFEGKKPKETKERKKQTSLGTGVGIACTRRQRQLVDLQIVQNVIQAPDRNRNTIKPL